VEDVASAVQSLEASILEDLASQVLNCDLQERRVLTTSRRLQNTDGIVHLDSAPVDEMDPVNGMFFLSSLHFWTLHKSQLFLTFF